ncbi:Fe-S protein assembly co-chaperone HscB [Rhodoferax koreense]|uniref:Co-chaperone protein HscB homolog n=1 Tax=Rhodoferax koreensis TaxID=1842727 RepID=A0A1P8K464_9BURK|nr:Fe-S protein assembly co-chaperone HscB [Rhodoferax koreense]APW40789.1 Fe-S protein assembly co-chaperone HscB [Rhodoferax koreense]
MNLQSNDFELFDIPPRFVQDRAAMEARWKALQREAHPDKFAAQAGAAQRVAMQWSVRINEAWQRLRDPLKRAAYLCELNGAPINAENNTAMPSAFLMQQMAWREALDDASSEAELEALQAEVLHAQKQTLAGIKTLLDTQHDYPGAAQQVRTLMFIERFKTDIADRIDAQADAGQ